MRGDNFGIDIFVTLIEQQGFMLKNDYGDEYFDTPFRNNYQIRDDFPKITRQIVGSNSVVKASYSINMSDLSTWLVTDAFLKKEIFP